MCRGALLGGLWMLSGWGRVFLTRGLCRFCDRLRWIESVLEWI